jgi:hypothetical protein
MRIEREVVEQGHPDRFAEIPSSTVLLFTGLNQRAFTVSTGEFSTEWTLSGRAT